MNAPPAGNGSARSEGLHWTNLVVWQLEDGVMASVRGAQVAPTLALWRRGAARGMCFVTMLGSNRPVKSDDVDWTDFPGDNAR